MKRVVIAIMIHFFPELLRFHSAMTKRPKIQITGVSRKCKILERRKNMPAKIEYLSNLKLKFMRLLIKIGRDSPCC